jgi:hypothetical protein
MSFPTEVWDGSTPNRDPALANLKRPDGFDWNVLTAELIATQTEVEAIRAGTSELTDVAISEEGSLNLGAFAAAYAVGSAVVVDDTKTAAAGFYAETVEDVTSAYMTRALRARHLVVTDSGTVAQETYGIQGQLCVKNTTLTHLHAGLLGTFEVSTAATLNSSYAVGHAAVIGHIGLGSAVTTATTPAAGILAFNNNAGSVTGKVYAFAAASAGTDTWDALLTANACDAFLHVPTATDYETGVKAVAGTAPTGTVTHFIKVLVDTTPVYIPCYNADTAG